MAKKSALSALSASKPVLRAFLHHCSGPAATQAIHESLAFAPRSVHLGREVRILPGSRHGQPPVPTVPPPSIGPRSDVLGHFYPLHRASAAIRHRRTNHRCLRGCSDLRNHSYRHELDQPSFEPLAPLAQLRICPQVRDGDFSYIGPGDIVDPPSQGYSASADENEPDIICLRHRGIIYPLHFRAYAIDDGVLSVGALRQEAAAKMGVKNPNQIRLLYKGNLLKDDSRPCKSEGLKQHSEVLCVVSEVGANSPSDVSDYDGRTSDPPTQRPGSSSSRLDGEEEPVRPSKKKNKKKNNKKKSNRTAGGEDALGSSASLGPPQPASDRSTTPMQPPNLKLIKTPLEQIAALVGYLQQELIPLCDEYVAHPPSDPKKREFEYRKLSETILAQIMLKADGIEPDGNETVRNARKALIREAQANLNRLDQANK